MKVTRSVLSIATVAQRCVDNWAARDLSLCRVPSAGQWARDEVLGWHEIHHDQAEPGDVVAFARRYSNATGHVGIVVGNQMTASSAIFDDNYDNDINGKIICNDWGFRPNQQLGGAEAVVFLRYTSTADAILSPLLADA